MASIVPRTPIYRRYKKLPTSRKARLDEARMLVKEPKPLIDDFAQSIQAFESYDRRNDAFHGPRSDDTKEHPRAVENTIQLALALDRYPGRGLHVPEAPDLSFDYVGREWSVMRTTGRAEWDDATAVDKPAGKPLVADLLLANRKDRTPIIGEVKVKTDKDPYAALIQALACAAHLATPNQLQRLSRAYEKAGFMVPDDGAAKFDIYLVPVAFPDGATWLPDLLQAADDLSERLLDAPQITHFIGRIACIEINRDSAGYLKPRLHFPR